MHAQGVSILDDPPRIALGPGSGQRPLTRFALIGDVHAEDERLETAIALARSEKVEAVLCVGDVADGFGDLARTIAILEREHVRVIRGNHDRWFLADTMRTLAPPVQLVSEHPEAESVARLWPPMLEVETIAGALLLCHAVGDDDMAVIRSDTHATELHWIAAWTRLTARARWRFMAAGHTHEAMVRTLDGITILNPGTLKRDKSPCTTIVDLELATMRVFDLADAHEGKLDRTFPIPI
jgi:putative phosphoesterase